VTRIAYVLAQQQVAVAGQRALDDGLDTALAPRDVRRRGDRDDVAELDIERRVRLRLGLLVALRPCSWNRWL
jgi:hypothetical protein